MAKEKITPAVRNVPGSGGVKDSPMNGTLSTPKINVQTVAWNKSEPKGKIFGK